jgi:hypothetical protein
LRAFISLEELEIKGFTIWDKWEYSKNIFEIDSLGSFALGESGEKCLISSESFSIEEYFKAGNTADLMIFHPRSAWYSNENGHDIRWNGTFPFMVDVYLSNSEFLFDVPFGDVTILPSNSVSTPHPFERYAVVKRPSSHYSYKFRVIDQKLSFQAQGKARPFESDDYIQNDVLNDEHGKISADKDYIINFAYQTFPANETRF